MTETERKTTFCAQCGQEVGTAKFCPNCGAELPNETPAEEPIEPIKEQAKKQTLWERFAPKNPVLSIILSVALVAVPAVTIVAVPNIIDHFEEVKQEREQKAAEQAFMDERQALWAEYATRWNSYTDQGATAPTKGTEYPFQMAEGYQDAVAFGSGEVSIDMEANYYFPDALGTVTYTSSAGYAETDVFALSYIFAGEEQANKLTRRFQDYISNHAPEGISYIQVVLSNTTDGVFSPSLEFYYQYYEFLMPDSEAFGLRSQNTLEDFVDNFNAGIVENGGTVSLEGLSANSFKYTGVDQWGYETYCCRDSVLSVSRTFTLGFSGPYIVSSSFAYDGNALDHAVFNLQVSFLTYLKLVPMSAFDISSENYYTLMGEASKNNQLGFDRGLILSGEYDAQGHPLFRVIASTESAYNNFKAGTLTANDGSASSPNSDPLALSYLEGWSWEANNGDGTSATLWEILDYELLGPSFTATENKTEGTVIVEDETSGLAIVFSANGGEPTIPPRSSVSEEEFVALCEDYMNILRGVQTQ